MACTRVSVQLRVHVVDDQSRVVCGDCRGVRQENGHRARHAGGNRVEGQSRCGPEPITSREIGHRISSRCQCENGRGIGSGKGRSREGQVLRDQLRPPALSGASRGKAPRSVASRPRKARRKRVGHPGRDREIQDRAWDPLVVRLDRLRVRLEAGMAEHGTRGLVVRLAGGHHARAMKGPGKVASESCVQTATAACVLRKSLAGCSGRNSQLAADGRLKD